MIAWLFPAGVSGGWLVDTLIATTVLCLIVLAVRRVVAHHFGPHVAYALWAIPALRMLLPPLPQIAGLPSPFATAPAQSGNIIAMSVPLDAASPSLIDTAMLLLATNLSMLLLGLWLAGAVLMLGWQWLIHRKLILLLADAELVETIGAVRVYRSDAVDGPLSFGLVSPVIVLPADDRLALNPAERMLAVRHELTHHARGDLWANGAAVLFAAMHWFNPLVRGAWRAFRFDQEAACDASVMARSDGSQRGVYARALAKTATGHPSAFASPMIGPESLKERLAMLTRPDVSPLRRRFGALLAVTFLVGAMVATATPVLADHPLPPAAPAAPAAPEAPQPPAQPSAQPSAQPPAQPPALPDPIRVDDRVTTLDIWNDNGRHVTRVRLTSGKTVVLRTEQAPTQAQVDRMVAEAEASRAEAERELGAVDQAQRDADRAERDADRAVHEADRAVRESDRAVHEADRALHESRAVATRITRSTIARPTGANSGHSARVHIRHAAITADCGAGAAAGEVATEIQPDADELAESRKPLRDMMCSGDGSLALQLSAMRQARAALAAMAGNAYLPAAAQAEALTELDREIARVEAQIAGRNN